MKKISIKREQSQAGLSFAEREKFRPQVKNKLLLLLALLMTAVTGAWAQSALTGAFTINADGDQVQFSSGNLQATYDGTNWTWAFATNQWDYIGNAAANTSVNGNGTVSENGTVDLFRWVGASSTLTGAAQYGITNSTTDKSTSSYGNNASESLKSDWGTLIGDGNTWRTLTDAEWYYLFKTRTTGGTVGSTAQARYAHAIINTDGTSVKGMILFPDGVDFAASEFTTLGTINGNASWNNLGTNCTSDQWTALAAKGCVFLPAAGRNYGANVYDAGTYGYYWSSSPDPSNNDWMCAYIFYFYDGNLVMHDGQPRTSGRSVRLVKTYEAPVYYSVTMKDGVQDADKWTITPNEGLKEGDAVTLTYSGRLKVKSVKATSDAAPAKEPATVTTAPTATTGDIKAGSTTALVSGGVADGGTLMYAVTTENTKPTSTDGFSADVPTAKTLAAGTYYVWYYVKADDTHTDSEIAATAISVTVKAGTPEYLNKLTKINDNYMDQVQELKALGRGYESYNSSLTAAQAYALATYQAAIDGKPVYVIMSSQNSGYEIHYALSTDAAATEHTAELYEICNESNPVRMYYVAQ